MQEGLKLLFAKIWNELIYANVSLLIFELLIAIRSHWKINLRNVGLLQSLDDECLSLQTEKFKCLCFE